MQSIVRKGYTVCPYISNDLVLAQRLEELGVHAVMPLASLLVQEEVLITH